MENIIEKLYYFTNQDLSKFTKLQNVNTYLERYVKNKTAVRLKRGIYVSQEQIDSLQRKNNITKYIEYITTNILLTPSYLSTEYILAKHHILIENSYATTAITTKKTTQIKNIFGNFFYQNIDEKLFWGYETKKEGDLISFQAYPEKALLDRLRLKKDIVLTLEYFKELRLERQNLDFTRLELFVKRYNKQKINQCFNLLKKLVG